MKIVYQLKKGNIETHVLWCFAMEFIIAMVLFIVIYFQSSKEAQIGEDGKNLKHFMM